MFQSSRKSKAVVTAIDDGSIHGVRSLIGASGISLDGESLLLPNGDSSSNMHLASPDAAGRGDRDGGANTTLDGRSFKLDSDDEDEMSSINSSIFMGTSPMGSSQPSTLGAYGGLKIIGSLNLVDSSTNSPPPDLGVPSSRSRSYSNPSPTSMDTGNSSPGQGTGADTKETAQTASSLQGAQQPSNKTEQSKRRECMPIWIKRAPKSVKIVLVAAIVLVILAVILVAVTLSVAFTKQNDESASAEAQTGFDDTVSVPSLSPTPAPTKWKWKPKPSNSKPTGYVWTKPSAPSSGVAENQPSYAPSAVPIPDSLITSFTVTAGRYPDTLLAQLPTLLPNLNSSSSTAPIILAHLGDWNSPTYSNCDLSAYEEVATLFSPSPFPVYFVPGDNEFNDCTGNEQKAIDNWRTVLVDYESTEWALPWNQSRQVYLPENYYFLHSQVIFVGLNLVSGSVYDQDLWDTRLSLDLEWVATAYESFGDQAKVMVLFSHSSPENVDNEGFFGPLLEQIENDYSDLHFVIVHRNDPGQVWEHTKEFNGISNLEVISVLGSVWPPMLAQIDLTNDDEISVTSEQEEWFQR